METVTRGLLVIGYRVSLVPLSKVDLGVARYFIFLVSFHTDVVVMGRLGHSFDDLKTNLTSYMFVSDNGTISPVKRWHHTAIASEPCQKRVDKWREPP